MSNSKSEDTPAKLGKGIDPKPRYYGGTDDYSNLQLAHHTCNKQKGHQHPNELQSKVTPPVFPSGVEETDNNERK